MAKVIRGRAGRMEKKATILEEYGATLAQMLVSQARPKPTDRVLHIGNAGAVRLVEQIAEQIAEGEIVVLVHTYDELEDARAALAGFGNVHVINEFDDLDPDEPPFDIVTCIAPYNLGRDNVADLIRYGVGQLAPRGTFLLAGDKQQDMARFEEMLASHARNVEQVAAKGQYRVVAVQAGDLRRGNVGKKD